MMTWANMAAVLAMILVLLTGCVPQVAEAPDDAVTVQLKWVHQAQFAGMYIADRNGFYADEHLAVTFKPGGLDISPADIIAGLVNGESDFAVVGGDQLLQARERGDPLVAIAVLFQKNPYVYVRLATSGIHSPRDLVGKRVMVPGDAAVLHHALLTKLGIDPESVELVPYGRDVGPLMAGEIDAHMVYRTGTGLAFDEVDADLSWMWVEDYGVQAYADTLVTTEAMIRDHPERVTRFLRATLKGWRYAIENPDEAVDLTLTYDPALERGLQARMMAAQIPFVHTGAVPIGWMTLEAWQATQATVLTDATWDVAQAFTTRFLDEAIGKGEEVTVTP